MNTLLRLGQLFSVLRQVEGRKKLQKIVHILQECGIDFNVPFEFSYYGPYSPELKTQIDCLTSSALLKEEEFQIGHYKGFRFSPEQRFESLLHELGTETDCAWKELALALNQKEATELEAISTIMYLESTGWKGDALDQRFRQIKPHLASSLNENKIAAIKLRSEAKAVPAA